MNRTDKFFYIFGWLLYALLAIIAFFQKTDIFRLTDIPAHCSFRQVTGLYCPGCGGTHAIMSLAAGHFIHSLFEHPLVLYTASCFAVFLLWNTACLVAEKIHCTPHFVHFRFIYVYIGIGIIFLQWIVKNILLFIA